MPPEYLETFLAEDETLPKPDAVLGLEDAGGQEPSEAPEVNELMRDPDVRAIVEATKGLAPAR
jgi:hypothetical protein